MNPTHIAVLLSCAALLAACKTFDADQHDDQQAEEFGASVRNMIQSQTYSPQTAAAVTAPVAPAMDGERAVEAVKTYRNDKAKIDESKAASALLVPSQIMDR